MKEICVQEYCTIGKKDEGHGELNDDDIYVGQNYVAVIDGVSHKSTLKTQEKQELKIARIIAEAIKEADCKQFKIGCMAEFIEYVNKYITYYLISKGLQDQKGKMEATGVVYSKALNQIWIVGDCRAIYDGKLVENRLKIDDLYSDIRKKIIQVLMQIEGWTESDLLQNDVAKTIIGNPEAIDQIVKTEETRKIIEDYRKDRLGKALLECGFSKDQIKEMDLIKKYANIRDLQQYLKNNPKAGTYGYSVFNGVKTEISNCKVVELPENVQTITLFSDGISPDAFKNQEDGASALRRMWDRAENDKLSVGENLATHSSTPYSNKYKYSVIGPKRATDDRSYVIIKLIERGKQETAKEQER